MRAMWKGSINFGLVSVPVRLYLAVEPSAGPTAHVLHQACGSRIVMRQWCPIDDRALERYETVRAFEVAPEQYVVVSDEEIDGLPIPTKHVIGLEQFVRADEARSVTRFARQTYYVAPEPLGGLAYALLRDVLAECALVAVGLVTLRERERLAALEPFGQGLLLTTLAWPDEIRPMAELELPGEAAVGRERAVALQLATALTNPFEPAAFRDGHRSALEDLVAAKVAGQAIVHAPTAPETPALVDLLAALEASVAEARRRREASAPEPIAPARPRRRRSAA